MSMARKQRICQLGFNWRNSGRAVRGAGIMGILTVLVKDFGNRIWEPGVRKDSFKESLIGFVIVGRLL
jgi:hypothetical protein